MASLVTNTQSKRKLDTPKTSLRGVKILSVGSYVPPMVVHNRDLKDLGCDEEWIVQRTGIEERRHCAPDEATSDLAYEAGKICLDKAGVSASELDMILVATMTPDHFTPSTSTIVQHRLGSHCVAFDMNAACSGFMYAFITAAQYIRSGSCQKILVIGADAMSRVIDPQDIKTYPLFGDGAGAVLVSSDSDRSEESGPGIRSYSMGTAGELGHLISVPGACSRMPASQECIDERQQFLKMDGRPVFKWAVRIVPQAIKEVLELANMSLDQIDSLLLHQANRRIIDAALEPLGISDDKVFVNLQHYGNTSAASIPLLLDEAIEQGQTSLDSNILLCGFGAGLTWGSCIYRG